MNRTDLLGDIVKTTSGENLIDKLKMNINCFKGDISNAIWMKALNKIRTINEVEYISREDLNEILNAIQDDRNLG